MRSRLPSCRLLLAALCALLLTSCASPQPSGVPYPVDTMLDPVTEEVPRVILP